jgi:hypothetical protein
MDLLFKRGDHPSADVWDRIIMEATGGVYVHTEIRFEDGRCFSSQAPGGVHIYDEIDVSDKTLWETISLPWSESPTVVHWCESIVGQFYNYVGAIASGIGLAVRIADRWFCSESSIEVMSRCGAVGVPQLLCPNALHDYVRGMLRGDSEEELADAVRRHHLLQKRRASSVAIPMSTEESLVDSWQKRLDKGESQEQLAREIERWYHAK